MKEFAKDLLELAAENAKFEEWNSCAYRVDKQSITDTINQIE